MSPLRTLRRHNARPLQDVFKISLGRAVLLDHRRPFSHKLDGVHLRPPDVDIGEGKTLTFNADGPLDDVKSRTGIKQPIHEAEVTAGYSFGWPQPDYQILHA